MDTGLPKHAILLFLFFSAFLTGRAGALGLQDIKLPPVAPAPSKITVDGKLDEWKSIAGYDYAPLGFMANGGGDAAIASLLTDPVSANVKFCYDPDALYVAVEWRDRNAGSNKAERAEAWYEGGEGFELHLLTGRVLHLACWPSPDGKSVHVMGRYGAETQWQDLSKVVSAAGSGNGDGKEYAQELRIPWTAITSAGKMPADGKLELGLDLAWNAIPRSLIDRLRHASEMSLLSARGVSLSFLTSHPGLAGAGYLPNPAEWGDLIFGGTPGGDGAINGPDGSTSLSSLAVPPAKEPPSMGASPAGWDDLFQTAGYLRALWGDRFTSRVAAEYDKDNLYLAAHFPSYAATGGPYNIKQEATQEGYNGGDALQIRLTDGKTKISLCGWYDNSGWQAALTADSKDLPAPFLLQQGARENFHADGHGFWQELSIPWKLLFGSAPKDGAKLKMTLQFWYADLLPLFSLHAKTTLERQGAISVSYKMPADGQLTLGLYDKDGKLLKWLAQDEYQYAGENKQAWDGLDQWGNPVPAGDYTLKALYHPPLGTDYKLTVCDPGNPPWPSPDGKGDWLSDESNPQAAVTDGKWVFIGAPNFEKGSSIIAVDETGQKQWGFNGSQGHCISLALDGDYLYALYSGPERTDRNVFNGKNAIGKAVLVCVDKKSGHPAKFTRETPKLEVATWPYRNEASFLWNLRNSKSFTPATYGGQPHYFCNDVGESTNAIGLAAAGGKLYASLLYDNKLIVIDPETGHTTGEIPLQAPAGLCAMDDHTLLAVSGKQVVNVNLDSKNVTPLITSNLVAPDSVTTDKVGNIYVSDWGASFQVKVFNSAGKFLRAIGKEGGRPWVGKWDPDGMLVPRGVAVTDEGKLWVAEDDGTPRRVSVWDASSGNFLKDYIGPTPYGCCTQVWANPKDATEINLEGTRFKVDYDKKTYTPEAINFRRSGLDAPFTPNGDGGCEQARVLYHDGHEYIATFGALGSRGVTILQLKDGIYQPVAAVGCTPGGVDPGMTSDGTVIDASDDIGHHDYPNGKPAFFKDHVSDNYSWTDRNGDFLVQPEEMTWVKTSRDYKDGVQAPAGASWGNAISDDWSIFFPGEYRDRVAIFRLDARGWTPDRAPIYDIRDARPIAFEPHTNNIYNLYATRDKHLIVSYDYEWGKSPDAVACYTFDGKKLWSTARAKRFSPKEVNATGTFFDFNIPGLGDVFATWSWHGNFRPYFITTDGLYVGTVLDDTKLGPAAIWGESPVFYFQAPDGTPYIINGADDQAHVLRIKGLDGNSCGRFEGAFQLSDSDAQKAAEMREIPETKPPAKPVIGVAWLDKPPVIDGDLSDWNLDRGVKLEGTGGRAAQVALGRDADNLYLAYQVREPTRPLVNNGGNWQTLFITGDCVDLMLATGPKADPHRRDAVAGDERLLFSVFQGQPVAVLYQPSVSSGTDPVQMGSTRIDKVIKLNDARVAVRRDTAGGAYTIEAAVPLKDLGIAPNEHDTLRGDVGVVYADESGQSRTLRLYYYNKHTEMVSDLATEAALQPSEWGTIQFPLGVNLLRNGDFEEPLVDSKEDVEKGWWVSEEANGNDARLSDESSYTGLRSLLLESSVPKTFPPEAYKDPKLGYKLWGWVVVGQRVPVSAGHQYSLRYHYRTEDLQRDDRRPGHPPGMIGYGGRIDWLGSVAGTERGRNTGGTQENLPDWQTVQDFNHGWDLPLPYTAPQGAVAANIIFSMSTRASGHVPRVFIDDVEFVDITPGAANPQSTPP